VSRTRKAPLKHLPLFHYEVFGRRNSTDTLHHLGYIVAPNVEYARSHAMMTYDEHRWIEFVMVLREHLVPIDGDANYQVGVV
jgi:hypothetical protein